MCENSREIILTSHIAVKDIWRTVFWRIMTAVNERGPGERLESTQATVGTVTKLNIVEM